MIDPVRVLGYIFMVLILVDLVLSIKVWGQRVWTKRRQDKERASFWEDRPVRHMPPMRTLVPAPEPLVPAKRKFLRRRQRR